MRARTEFEAAGHMVAIPSREAKRGVIFSRSQQRLQSIVVTEWGDFYRETRVPLKVLIRQLGITVEDVERAQP